MLGKIFTVCVLLSVSACLVRPQPTSQEKIAGIADDVAKLISKVGAKSTDEAVAKLWAKGGELSDDEAEVLGKLLKSSDKADALAALQRPVTSKLYKLDNMLAEYHKGQVPYNFRQRMLADIDETLADINTNMVKYDNFRSKFIYDVPSIKYPATQVLQLDKIQGVDIKLLDKFVIIGEFNDVVAASLLTRNFHNIKLAASSVYKVEALTKSDLTTLNKVFKSGNLEKDVYPIYNKLIEERSLRRVAYETYMLELFKGANFAKKLSSIKTKLFLLRGDLQVRTKLLNKLDISAARKAQIRSGSLRNLRGAGRRGRDKLGDMSLVKWAENIRTSITKSFKKAHSKLAFVNKEHATKRSIDAYLAEIKLLE